MRHEELRVRGRAPDHAELATVHNLPSYDPVHTLDSCADKAAPRHHHRRMDDALRAIVATRGVFLRSEARDLGYDDRGVAAALRAGVWVRVRRGAYTFHDIWENEDAVGRHRILSRAVMRSLGDGVALTHTSAVVEHGFAVWGTDLSRVHVTRLDGGTGRTEKDVVHHKGLCGEGDIVQVNGIAVMSPPRAVIETATLTSVESGLVTTDSALHRGAVDPEQLERAFRSMERWPHTQKVHLVLAHADAQAESPGESRSRYLFWTQGLPAPQLQFKVYDEHGNLVGVTDFAWPEHRLLGEFDGKVKYGRLLKPGEDPGEAVFREKKREDRLREVARCGMVRVIWADLSRPFDTAGRVRRLMKQAA